MLVAGDEYRQTPTDMQPGTSWWESHRLIAYSADTSIALATQVSITVGAAQSLASFYCVVFRSGLLPIVIADCAFQAPTSLWEFRTSGLWVDTICETPFEHWSYGLEAFGLEITDGDELLGRGYGNRVPLGWELEVEHDGSSDPVSFEQAGYDQSGEAHGLLLFADGETEFSGTALRQHWWGSTEPELASPVLAGLDRRINDWAASLSPAASSSNGAESHLGPVPSVALPLEVPTQNPHVWWLTRTASGLVAGSAT